MQASRKRRSGNELCNSALNHVLIEPDDLELNASHDGDCKGWLPLSADFAQQEIVRLGTRLAQVERSQFPGGSFTRWSPAPVHGALFAN
jgi:hypothetical protein